MKRDCAGQAFEDDERKGSVAPCIRQEAGAKAAFAIREDSIGDAWQVRSLQRSVQQGVYQALGRS